MTKATSRFGEANNYSIVGVTLHTKLPAGKYLVAVRYNIDNLSIPIMLLSSQRNFIQPQDATIFLELNEPTLISPLGPGGSWSHCSGQRSPVPRDVRVLPLQPGPDASSHSYAMGP